MRETDNEMMARVLSEAQADLESHARTRNAVRNVALCADGSKSAEEAGRLLLNNLGSEQAVKQWVDSHAAAINRALTLWYAMARLEEHETKGSKK